MGVWQIRENVRNAFSEKPLSFSTIDLALSYIASKISVPIEKYKEKSALLDSLKNQKRLTEWC